MQEQQQASSPSTVCNLAVPTFQEYALEQIERIRLSAAQKALRPEKRTEEAVPVVSAHPLFSGWTMYGYWHEGELYAERPW